ncbi:MAG: hypothetical protein MI922_17280 [Bacteroidales bacterium]|nr:hypothetical protein [Bacteroidales bacterium]
MSKNQITAIDFSSFCSLSATDENRKNHLSCSGSGRMERGFNINHVTIPGIEDDTDIVNNKKAE